jgi:hypothetical protein
MAVGVEVGNCSSEVLDVREGVRGVSLHQEEIEKGLAWQVTEAGSPAVVLHRSDGFSRAHVV